MATLFDLHRSVKIVRIAAEDGRRLADGEEHAGEVITIGIKSPTQATHSYLLEVLTDAREEAEAEAKASGLLENLKLNAGSWTREQLVDLILRVELGSVQEESDLAPNADGEGLSDAEKKALTGTPEQQRAAEQAEAVKRRQDRRKTQLEELPTEELIEILAELQMRLAILAQSTAKFMTAQLCVVIVHPEPPYAPMFSYTEKDESGQPNENWIGNLQPATVNLLNDIRSEFFAEMTDKKLRAQATNPGFTKAGRSRSNRRGFRGGIGKTPATFRPALSDSSASASGSIASTKS